MPDEIATEIPAAAPKKRKPGRPRIHGRFAKKDAKPTPAPKPVVQPAENPAILSLQQDVVTLVRKREQIADEIAAAQAEFFLADAKLKNSQTRLAAIGAEVQYRMQVIGQMRGDVTPHANVMQMPPAMTGTYGTPPPLISSAPTDLNDPINRGHATRAML